MPTIKNDASLGGSEYSRHTGKIWAAATFRCYNTENAPCEVGLEQKPNGPRNRGTRCEAVALGVGRSTA
jgi:hypothetical protein